MLPTITANFLGQEAATVTEPHINGTVKEMTNMIIGNTLGNFNPGLEFHIELPALIVTNKFAASDPIMDDIFVHATTEIGPMAASLRFK